MNQGLTRLFYGSEISSVLLPFHRGDPKQPQGRDRAGWAHDRRATRAAVHDPDSPATGRRLAYARWLTSGTHPLVARVLVNRVWMHHFGRGLVSTPSDFGTRGARPTHPELLDWLASEFVEQGWSVKHLHRLITSSTVYRQSSHQDPAKDAVDRDNRFLSRKPIQRLEAGTRQQTKATDKRTSIIRGMHWFTDV